MTANRNFKRLVRARARKTGESYAAALRHFQTRIAEERQMASPNLRRVEKPEYGFAIYVPEDWREHPPDLRNSPWEVALFSGIRPGDHNCRVFRNLAQPGTDAATLARGAQAGLEAGGFGNFRLTDAKLAAWLGARLDFDRPTSAGGVWAVRHYFIIADGITFIVSFGSSNPEQDAELLDTLAAKFELLGHPTEDEVGQLRRPVRRVVEKSEYGFALELPEGWIERPPNLKSNPWEVARFTVHGDARHLCQVSRRPRPDRTAREVAEENQEALKAAGFGNFKLIEATLAGRPGVRLDAELRDAGRIWAERRYFIVVNGINFTLHLASSMPDEDATLLDTIAAGFQLLPPS